MDREQIDNWCERGVLGLILAMVVFAVLANGAVQGLQWTVVQGLMCGVLLLWIPRFWLRSGYRILCPPLAWAVVAFTAYTAIIYTRAPIEYAARSELLKVLVYAFVFFAVVDNLQSQERTHAVVYTLVFLGMAVSIYAVYQYLTDSPYIWFEQKHPGYARRASGTYHCPNHLAGFLELVLPLALAFVITGRGKVTLKVFIAYAALAMLAGVAVTVSRGGWIATASALTLVVLLLLKNRTFRLPAALILALLVGGGFYFFQQSYHARERLKQAAGQDKTLDMRFRLWQPAIAIWKENFWWGAGPGHFDHAFRRHRPHDIQMRPLYAHNDYLNTLADYGTAGGAIVLAALGLLGWSTIRTWKFVQRSGDIGSRQSSRSALVLGATAGLVALLVHSLVDFNLHIPANALVAVILMALLSAHIRYATERFWVNPRLPGRLLATLLLTALAGGLAWQTWRSARHDRHFARARTAATNEQKVALLKQAHSAEPQSFEAAYELGEVLRLWSWQGATGYEELAREALSWFERAMQLNPLDPYSPARYGMCLHWLERHQEAQPWFEKALALDPRNYYIVGLMGWHDFQLERWDSAKERFEESRALALRRFDIPWPDQMSWHYIRLIERKQKEEAERKRTNP